MTVSNVLRGRAGVRKEKRDQVFAALEKLGVSPESLRTVTGGKPNWRRRTRSFVLIEGGVSRAALSSPVYSEILRGVEERCRELGWMLQIRYVSGRQGVVELAQQFTGSGALLFGPGADAGPLVEGDEGLAVVRLLQPPYSGETVDRVTYNGERVGALAAQWLQKKGRKRLVYLGPDHLTRGEAFCSEARRAGAEVLSITDDQLFADVEGVQQINHEVLNRLWEKAAAFKPDGIFSYSDHVTVALYSLLYRVGIHPGTSLDVVSCNREEPFLSVLNPQPVSIDIHAREIGRVAVDQLVWRIDHPEASRKTVLLEPEIPKQGKK